MTVAERSGESVRFVQDGCSVVVTRGEGPRLPWPTGTLGVSCIVPAEWTDAQVEAIAREAFTAHARKIETEAFLAAHPDLRS